MNNYTIPEHPVDEPLPNAAPDYEGPWRVDDSESSETELILYVRDCNDEFVCELRYAEEATKDDAAWKAAFKETGERSDLIAAAPDMYDALELALAYAQNNKAVNGGIIASDDIIIKASSAAIAKAKGGPR